MSQIFAVAVAHAGPGEHPQNERFSAEFVWDWDRREFFYRMTVETISDGQDSVPVDVNFEAWDPSTGP